MYLEVVIEKELYHWIWKNFVQDELVWDFKNIIAKKKVKTLGRKVIKWQISTILGTSHLGSKKLRLPRAVSLKV